MKDSIRKRIEQIHKAETSDDLRKCLCPFFEKGGHPDCPVCRKTEPDLEECKEYYLGRIMTHPMDFWTDDFDAAIVQSRDTLNVEDIVGIGSNCDNCYMSEKCPLYKSGYACGINWGSNIPKTPSEFMDFLINMQYERVRRAAVFEKLDGGAPYAGLSGEMDRLTDYLNTKDNMGRDRLSINVEASGASRQSGGILSKLFGGGEPKAIPEKPESTKDIIDITEFQEVKSEPVKVSRKRKQS
jgi:hypothetical protein|nr:MAG TPA: hypothetical protein [Herelleviridae sp.]